MSHQQISRRVALLAPSAVVAGVVAACSGGKERSSTPRLKGPALLRDQAKSLEPQKYVKTYRVDASGAAGAYKTFAEAYAAVSTDRAARIGAGAPAQSNPWDWRRIEVAAGDYHECIKGVPPHTAIIGLGSRPEDVHVWWDGGDNTFESTGRSTYVRNIHIDHTDPNPDAHAMRDNGPSGDIDMRTRQRRTVVYEKVKFSSPRTASLGKCTNDMAPRGGVSLTFRECVFNGPGQPQSINLLTSQSAAPGPSLFAFLGCTVVSNHEQHPSAEWKQLSQVDAAPLGAPDFAGGRGDTVLWMDGRWDVGKTHGVQALMVFPYVPGVDQTGVKNPRVSTRYVLVEPGSVPGIRTELTTGAAKPLTTVPNDLALPTHGLSEMEASFYGEAPTGQSTLYPAGDTADTLQVAAGDVYWVALPAGKSALCVTGIVVESLTTEGALVGSAAVDDGGKPLADPNGRALGAPGGVGAKTAPLNLRWFYPGQGRVWVGVTFTTAATVSAVRAAKGSAYKGSGGGEQMPTPNGLTPVGADELVPRVGVMSSLPPGMR